MSALLPHTAPRAPALGAKPAGTLAGRTPMEEGEDARKGFSYFEEHQETNHTGPQRSHRARGRHRGRKLLRVVRDQRERQCQRDVNQLKSADQICGKQAWQ